MEIDSLPNLTEIQIVQISRYLADYVQHEIAAGKTIDTYTFFWAFDAIMKGALDD
jgi:hypothetical protein